jgi:molybdate transport system substrate-binding protein
MCAPFFRCQVFCRQVFCWLALGFFALVVLVGVGGCRSASSGAEGGRAQSRPLRVAAASDLEPAFVELGRRFHAATGRQAVFSFASSSVLAQQVRQGAPLDLFAAANRELVDQLVQSGQLVAGSARPYARGRLVMWTRRSSPEKQPGAPSAPSGITELSEPRYRRISLANPDHAPYGKAAVQALRASGLLDALRPRLVYAENVRQAHQYVATGNADVALGALSLAMAAGAEGSYTPVADELYPELVQVLGVVRGGDEAAAGRFAELILDAAGQELLGRHGFLPAPAP